MREDKIEVPKELRNSFFFPDNMITIRNENVDASLNLSMPFMYEALYYTERDEEKPWADLEKSIPLLLMEWSLVKQDLEAFFKERNKAQILAPMKKGIGLFIQFLHWANQKPVRMFPQINYDNLRIKPVNIQERLEFILSRPTAFHSFRQLEELMTELEKGYSKEIAIRRLK